MAKANEKNNHAHGEDFREEELKYRTIFDKSPVGLFRFDRNLVITECNSSFIKILRANKEQIIGFDLHNLRDTSILPPIEDTLSGIEGDYEGLYRTTFSSVNIYLAIKTVPLHDTKSDKVVGGIGIVQDITERVIAEKKLAQKEEYFRILSMLTTDAASILTVNPDGTFNREWIGTEFLNEIGYAEDDIGSFEKWAKIVHPDDLHIYTKAVESIKTGKKVTREFRIISKDGRTFWISNTVSPEFDSNGKLVRLISAVKNINERKYAELELVRQKNLLNTIVENAPVGIWIAAPDGSYSMINQNFANNIGYGTPNRSITKEELDQCHASDSMTLKSENTLEVEEQVTFIDGIKHTLRIFKKRLEDLNGDIIGVLGVSTDITDRIIYEKALVEAMEKAEESDKLKSAFLANMSHEIRTPLNGVIGFAKYLKNFPETSSDERSKFLGIICNSADHLLALINDIIDISKIDVGQLKINPEPVNLNNLLNEIYTFYYSANPNISKQGLSFRVTTTMSDQEANIIADGVRLRQIINNLVGNALKFTEKGFVEFGYEFSADKSTIKFYVSDTGIGIPDDKMEKIFQRFCQADLSVPKKYGGTGLGLTISKSLVELMGGKIWVESEENVGSNFYFTIPFVKDKEMDSRKVQTFSKGELIDICEGKQVLIAEDDSNSLFYLKTILKDLGITCIEAQNGMDAIEMFKSYPDVHLIMMDLKMPIIGGFDAIKEIRKLDSNVPIVVQTAHAFNNERIICRTLGVDEFLTKPIDINNLYGVIGRLIKRV